MPTLSVKISGSIVGEAIQEDMMGARGTPLKSRPAITGTTLHEQNGLNAPTRVASKMAVPTLALKGAANDSIQLERPDKDAKKMLMRNKGQTFQTAAATN
jgi:phospholipase/lecithinase/hemolysin